MGLVALREHELGAGLSCKTHLVLGLLPSHPCSSPAGGP